MGHVGSVVLKAWVAAPNVALRPCVIMRQRLRGTTREQDYVLLLRRRGRRRRWRVVWHNPTLGVCIKNYIFNV